MRSVMKPGKANNGAAGKGGCVMQPHAEAGLKPLTGACMATALDRLKMDLKANGQLDCADLFMGHYR